MFLGEVRAEYEYDATERVRAMFLGEVKEAQRKYELCSWWKLERHCRDLCGGEYEVEGLDREQGVKLDEVEEESARLHEEEQG
ncbi:unnamed protein product [Calypogeia fissa]